MDMTKLQFAPSFSYGGAPFRSLPLVVTETETDNGKVIVETCGDLQVTTKVRFFPDFSGVEWVHWFENTGNSPTKIIDQLRDCDVALDFPHQAIRKNTAYIPDEATRTALYHAPGCNDRHSEQEFCPQKALLDVGKSMTFASGNGRSSQKTAPFFHVTYQNVGVVLGIGWTGQWQCTISRQENTVTVRSGLELAHFRLLPGEKIRTTSMVMMAYEGDCFAGQNRWRRFLKAHFSLIGQEGRDPLPPFSACIWGGMSSPGVLDRVRLLREEQLPFSHIWMDAGWYGPSTQESPDEFEGDWSAYTGDWRVNETHHPDGLLAVIREIKDAGYKFLLWFEPERVIPGAPILEEHPEYFLLSAKRTARLLNLGDEAAWQYCYETLRERFTTLQVDCYRQDFNIEPLIFWQENDTEDRQGMTEIRYIMGLYRLWDALLEAFPHLSIDNCASGGRRLDMETMRRSVPLWRTDYTCAANFRPEGSQCHSLGYGAWMPYSGTGSGRGWGDTYRIRSAYGSGLGVQHLFSERDPLPDQDARAWLRKYTAEYNAIQPYFSCDMYPLMEISGGDSAWNAVEYFDPDKGSGIIQVFRHKASPFDHAILRLYGLEADKTYQITDADTDERICEKGRTWTQTGFPVHVPEQRCAKLFYLSEA